MCVHIYPCDERVDGYKKPPALRTVAAASGDQPMALPDHLRLCVALDPLTVPNVDHPPTAWTWPVLISMEVIDAQGWGFLQVLPKLALLLARGMVVGWPLAVRSCPAALGEFPWPLAQKAANPLWTLTQGLSEK